MKRITLLILLLSFNLKPVIIESLKIDIIEKYNIDKTTLVAFDIDNTIMEPVTQIGSDQWFDAMVQYEKDKNPDKDINLLIKRKVLPYYYDEQRKAKVKLVESEVSALVKSLQEREIPTIALTLRGISLLGLTRNQLLSLGIDFIKNNLTSLDLVLESDFSEPAVFYKGILFTNGNSDKSKILKIFLERIGIMPKKIIMIDDKLKYLIGFEKLCNDLKIEFIGIRYAACDEKVKNFKLDHSTIIHLN